MSVAWEPDAGLPGPEAVCRGCPCGLWRQAWGWEDADGSVVCVPARGETGFVPHLPMPAGYRGAPLDALSD